METFCYILKLYIRIWLKPSKKSILKSKDIILLIKVCIVKAMGFPVVAYRCESCTIKKAERQRIDSLDCGVGDDFLDCKEIKPVNPKGNQS